MTIYQGSRYENSPVVVLRSDRGYRPGVLRSAPSPARQFVEVVVGANENLQLLAARVLNDPERWWVIADANPEWPYPDEIPAGSVLRIPYANSLR